MPITAEVSPLAIVNDALGELSADPLTDLLPESGRLNDRAGRQYTRRVDALLTERAWNFATRIVLLSALTEAPPSPWTVQYALPAGTLRVVSTDIPAECYTLASENTEDGTRRLYATRTGIRAVVVVRPADETLPAYFVEALIADIAWKLAPFVTGDTNAATYFGGLAHVALSKAKMHDAAETPSPRIPAFDPRYGGFSADAYFPRLTPR